jgi:hypothetical protein
MPSCIYAWSSRSLYASCVMAIRDSRGSLCSDPLLKWKHSEVFCWASWLFCSKSPRVYLLKKAICWNRLREILSSKNRDFFLVKYSNDLVWNLDETVLNLTQRFQWEGKSDRCSSSTYRFRTGTEQPKVVCGIKLSLVFFLLLVQLTGFSTEGFCFKSLPLVLYSPHGWSVWSRSTRVFTKNGTGHPKQPGYPGPSLNRNEQAHVCNGCTNEIQKKYSWRRNASLAGHGFLCK